MNNIGFKAGHTEKRSVENSLKNGTGNPMAGAEQLSNQIRAGISFKGKSKVDSPMSDILYKPDELPHDIKKKDELLDWAEGQMQSVLSLASEERDMNEWRNGVSDNGHTERYTLDSFGKRIELPNVHGNYSYATYMLTEKPYMYFEKTKNGNQEVTKVYNGSGKIQGYKCVDSKANREIKFSLDENRQHLFYSDTLDDGRAVKIQTIEGTPSYQKVGLFDDINGKGRYIPLLHGEIKGNLYKFA